jgi:hypothetical protein
MDAELRTASDQRTAWWARAKELESENERLRRVVGYIASLPIVLDDKANRMTLGLAVDVARREACR